MNVPCLKNLHPRLLKIVLNLVEIGPLVLEKIMKMSKVYRQMDNSVA